MYVLYLCKITSPQKGEENYQNLTQRLKHFPFPDLSCVGDDTGLFICVVRPTVKHLGLLLQVLEPPRQIVKVDVIRVGGVSAEGG